MVQKFYAIKSEDSIHKGTIISTLFAVVVAGGCYFLGGFGRLFADQVDVASEGYDAIIPAMLSGLPDLLIAVVVILVLSASMSTLSSLVIASSSTLTIDLLKGNIVKKMNDFQAVFIMRCFIVVFVLISMVLAIVQYKNSFSFIAQLMGVSWGALAGSFLAPFLYGLYWKKTTKSGLLGLFPLWFGDYDSKSDLHLHRMVCFSHPAAILDQLRRLRHAGRPCDCPCGELVHQKA